MRVSMNLTAKGCSVSDRDKASKEQSVRRAAELVMADGSLFLDYLKDAASRDTPMDEWTAGYEECKRRLLTILGPQLERLAVETSEESDPCVSHLAMREYEKALDSLWDLLDGTDEDARTGDVTIESADWQRWLVVFWNLGDGYRERLANLGWSPPKTSTEPQT